MNIKNEQGYALISVLLVISIFSIIILSIMSQSFNTVKQNQVLEKNYQSVALAEMGVTYYLAINKNLIPSATAATANNPTNFCTEFLKELESQNYLPQYPVGDSLNSYQIIHDSFSNSCQQDQKTIVIGFTSIGSTGSGPPTRITGSFKLVNTSRAGESAPILDLSALASLITSTGTSIVYVGDVNINQQDSPTPISGPAFFQSITLHGQGEYKINNDAYIMGSISLNGHTQLKINGDAIFYNSDPIDKKTNKANLCITGNTYYVSNGKLVDLDISAFNRCANSNPKNDWNIDPQSGITVTYPN